MSEESESLFTEGLDTKITLEKAIDEQHQKNSKYLNKILALGTNKQDIEDYEKGLMEVLALYDGLEHMKNELLPQVSGEIDETVIDKLIQSKFMPGFSKDMTNIANTIQNSKESAEIEKALKIINIRFGTIKPVVKKIQNNLNNLKNGYTSVTNLRVLNEQVAILGQLFDVTDFQQAIDTLMAKNVKFKLTAKKKQVSTASGDTETKKALKILQKYYNFIEKLETLLAVANAAQENGQVGEISAALGAIRATILSNDAVETAIQKALPDLQSENKFGQTEIIGEKRSGFKAELSKEEDIQQQNYIMALLKEEQNVAKFLEQTKNPNYHFDKNTMMITKTVEKGQEAIVTRKELGLQNFSSSNGQGTTQDKIDLEYTANSKITYKVSVKAYKTVGNKAKVHLQDVTLFYTLQKSSAEFAKHWIKIHMGISKEAKGRFEDATADAALKFTMMCEALAYGNLLKEENPANLFVGIDTTKGRVMVQSISSMLAKDIKQTDEKTSFTPIMENFHFNPELSNYKLADEARMKQIQEYIDQIEKNGHLDEINSYYSQDFSAFKNNITSVSEFNVAIAQLRAEKIAVSYTLDFTKASGGYKNSSQT